MHGLRDLVEAGGLMSYAANFPDLFRRTAGLVDKILRGVKPAEIPVEQPTKFDLVVNINTAKALGLTIPRYFLGPRRRGDRVGARGNALCRDWHKADIPRRSALLSAFAKADIDWRREHDRYVPIAT
jgi:hypothetical protein